MKEHRKLSKQHIVKKKYQIRVQDELVPVTEEVYLTYYRMRRRELHLQEKDAIPDLISPRVEDIVVDKLMTLN